MSVRQTFALDEDQKILDSTSMLIKSCTRKGLPPSHRWPPSMWVVGSTRNAAGKRDHGFVDPFGGEKAPFRGSLCL